ncbi:alpha/beta hydrolase family protein [Thalassobaculum sp. OXR-137]|uniref:alpha/beta hydrolase n=1 Tax=Thalassobaculum sp. OXR-137 TaxID=3100173 RepID=UPI002AC8AECE|nr:alpha/beta hydrolase family protein [Thalassobaculum sp. OXR-137]WPZ32773.1 alpha/beta hydrolase family protein [Thalassobaculum sp. OXR-137]
MSRNLPLLVAALAWLLAVAPAAAGTLDRHAIPSPILGQSIDVRVYRPANAAGPLPVVYLLHGYGGGAEDWTGGGDAQATAEAVFAAPDAVPMLLVMPGVGNSWYVESEKYGAWSSALVQDLIPAIDRLYETRTDRSQRFVAGLSMGGYGALRLATHYPALFRAAAAFSPAVFEDVASAADFPEFQLRFFADAFGEPFEAARFNRANVFAPLKAIPPELAVDFYIMTGDHDALGLWDGALKFFRAARGAGHAVELRVRDGDHEWRLWREELAPALHWFAGLSRSADRR